MNEKFYFEHKVGKKSYRIRAVCAIFVDNDDHERIIMVKESPKEELTHDVLGFAGGKCDEELDANIGQTLIREIYEECFLHHILPQNWNGQWPAIKDNIISDSSNKQKTKIDQFLAKIYSKYNLVRYHIYGKGVLKVIYFRFFLDTDDIKTLRNGNNVVPVSYDLLTKLNEAKRKLGVVECTKYLYIINGVNSSIRLREVEVVDTSFLKFLTAPESSECFSANSVTKSETVEELSKKPSREYLVLVDNLDWQCFIPEDEFNKYFTIVLDKYNDPTRVVINKELFGPYFSSDTYLQSYCLWHARSSVRPGKWNVHLLGVYHLDF